MKFVALFSFFFFWGSTDLMSFVILKIKLTCLQLKTPWANTVNASVTAAEVAHCFHLSPVSSTCCCCSTIPVRTPWIFHLMGATRIFLYGENQECSSLTWTLCHSQLEMGHEKQDSATIPSGLAGRTEELHPEENQIA